MADTLDVLSLTEGKRALQLGAASTKYDTKLAQYITGISRAMDHTFGPIVNRTITGELHNGGASFIFPNKWPVYSVGTLVEYDQGTAGTLTAETTTATGGYLVVNPAGVNSHIVRRDNRCDYRFAHGRSNIYLTYTAGRATSTGSVDADFKLGAGLFLKNVWRSEEQGVVEVDEFEIPRQNFPTFSTPRVVKELLAQHVQGPRF